MNYNALRSFVDGKTTKSQLLESVEAEIQETDDDVILTDEDEELIQETLSEVMPYLIADEIMSEAYEKGELVFHESMTELEGFLKTNGLLDESFSMKNPKKNFVRLNKKAILERLRSILIIKLARKNKDKNYKKYKIGTKIKRNSFKAMEDRWGAKATPMAKKAFAAKSKKSRISTVVDAAKAAVTGNK